MGLHAANVSAATATAPGTMMKPMTWHAYRYVDIDTPGVELYARGYSKRFTRYLVHAYGEHARGGDTPEARLVCAALLDLGRSCCPRHEMVD